MTTTGTSEAALMREAMNGSVDAHLQLVECAIAAGENGGMRRTEAFIAAETFARMAAASGDGKAVHKLAAVLLARSQFESERGLKSNSAWYRAEAVTCLRQLAAAGDDGADKILKDLNGGPTPPPIVNNFSLQTVEYDRLLKMAGKGDIAALAILYDQVLNVYFSNGMRSSEPLTVLELYARLGASNKDVGQVGKLIDTLMLRAAFEYRNGNLTEGEVAEADAIILIAELANDKSPGAEPILKDMIVNGKRWPSVYAALTQPIVLAYLKAEGTC